MTLPQRQALLLQGDADWLTQQAKYFYQQDSKISKLWLSDDQNCPKQAEPIKTASQHLGKEFGLIIFDAQQFFKADAFAAILGTLTAGGLIIILLADEIRSLWLQRFIRLYKQQSTDVLHICQQGHPLPVIGYEQRTTRLSAATEEQGQAIAAVLKVVSGHRKRPLVLSSDRGRGKSALLGMAAAELLQSGKQRIIVTSPNRAQTETLFRHAQSRLDNAELTKMQLLYQQATIAFVAPDILVSEQAQADLLIVDEAAAIPLSMLEKLLNSYSRIVFSTTIHGYEGTGRGFSLRFNKTLDKLTPNWRRKYLDTPIRWGKGDALEQFSFDSLLLNAEPVDDNLVANTQPQVCQFELLDAESLLEDEGVLRELFGLMVLAHYRTRPSDLQMLLDNDDVRLAVLKYQGHIVACVWLVDEPAMQPEIAEAVFNGNRKPKGHLLPQSLLLYSGIPDAGTLHYQRILRIAVHPACQNRGLGSFLLEMIKQQADCDMLGTSYALDMAVYHFWQRNGFRTIKVGVHADHVTGSPSILMLMPVSEAGQAVFLSACQKLQTQWPYLLSRSLSDLAIDAVCAISSEFYQPEINSEITDMLEIERFAYQQRPYDSVEVPLWQWMMTKIGSESFNQLEQQQQNLLIRTVIQQHPLQAVISEQGLAGRAELIRLLRTAVTHLIELK